MLMHSIRIYQYYRSNLNIVFDAYLSIDKKQNSYLMKKKKKNWNVYSFDFPRGGNSRFIFSCPNINSCMIRFPCSRCAMNSIESTQRNIQVQVRKHDYFVDDRVNFVKWHQYNRLVHMDKLKHR